MTTRIAFLLAAAVFGVAQNRMDVKSSDGTNISVIKAGSGPAMLLVHGSASVGLSWATVFPGLAPHFTIYAMDRRGRAPSGDAPKYSVQAEIDDMTSVIAAIGQPVTLVAHSYGAFITVAGLGQLKNVNRLILYEPPVYEKPRPGADDLLVELNKAWAAGDRDTVMKRFMEEVLGGSAYATMHASPAWAGLLSVAGTIPREVEAVNKFKASPEQMGKWTVPTTMLLGTESPAYMKDGTAFVCRSIPGCQVVMLEGQGHMAPQRAPALFVEKVMAAAAK